MLVTTRKLGEKIMIGADITITVVDILKGRVVLGIDAPRHIAIYREEVLPLVAAKSVAPKEKGEWKPGT